MKLNISAMVLFWPGFPFTAAGAAFAASGSNRFKNGDAEGARKKSAAARALFIVGVILGLAGWVWLMMAALHA